MNFLFRIQKEKKKKQFKLKSMAVSVRKTRINNIFKIIQL